MTLSRSPGTNPEVIGVDLVGAQPLDMRLALAALLAAGGAGLAVRAGVFAGVPAALVVGTDGFAYRVRSAFFAVQRTVYDGVHLLANDGDVDVVTDATPGTPGASRIDIVWVSQPSAGENGDATSTPMFGVAIGEPSAGVPNPPTLPVGAMEIARNTMTSAATSTSSAGNTIAQTWRYTALRGTPIPVRNATERDELDTLASATNPVIVDRLDTGQLERNAGSGWALLVPGVARGEWRLAADQPIVPGTFTLIDADQPVGSPDVIFSNVNGAVTVARAGWYVVTVEARWASTDGAVRALYVTRNGATIDNATGAVAGGGTVVGRLRDIPGATDNVAQTLATKEFELAAGDVIRAFAGIGGTTVSLVVGSPGNYLGVTSLSIRRLGS